MMTGLPATLLCLLVAGCASSSNLGTSAPAPATSDAPAQPTAWRAVLVAGDDAEPAFDNAVDVMAQRLEELGVARANMAILKANGQGDQEATTSNIVSAFSGLAATPSEGCFVFATSHGGPGRGLFMKRARAFLTPADLDHLLNDACRGRPTVVIASGCFSGSFAEGPRMPAANRVILTAARDDRPSFGCNADRTLTVFDQCVLDSLDGGARWQGVMEKARACVAANERALHVDAPSEPQISIGADVTGLLVFPRLES
jgi:hypothetical protein